MLARESRVQPLVESIEGSGADCEICFLCSPDDAGEIEAVKRAGLTPRVVHWDPGPGDYAKKINYGFDFAVMRLNVEWVFFGADDLHFHPGWLEACVRRHEETGACVIGTNDLGNAKVMRGNHSTHSLVHRDYSECGTADDVLNILHEGYDHQWVDNEFIETAQARDTFAFAADAHVEHLHPMWKKGTMDATYEKALAHARADQLLFQRRRRLWT